MSNQSEESLPTAVDSSAPNINEQALDKEDTEIAAKVGHISLEGQSKINHSNHNPSVSTSISNNESSKDGILEGEEGELDYEEDEGEILEVPDNKPDPPKKTTSKKEKESDGEEGELEDGEVNSDGEEGEILSDQDDKDDYKKKGNKEEGEINEDDLEEGEVRDGDPYSSNQGSRVPRKLCRYFVSGSCTWGVSCRFLHPGVNDKGAYHMLPHPGQYPVPYVRPPPPPPPLPMISDAAPASVLQAPTTDLHPEDEDDLLGQPESTSDVKAAITEKETAWERGIRLAKENKKAALRRKEEDTDFEQKRMLLSISVDAEDEEGNKENQAKRQDLRDRLKKDDSDRGSRSSRWRDSTESSSRYYNKDRDKKKRRSRRSPSSSPERSKYDRRRDEKESSKTSDREQDVDRWRDKGRPRNPKPDDQKKDKQDKDSPPTDRPSKEPSVSSTKDVEPSPKAKPKKRASKDSEKESSHEEEGGEADKSKGKSYFSISNNRLANDDWHDPWQRTTSPKRRSPRRRSTTSTYSSRSRTRSSSSSSASSRSSRSRSRTPSSTGSESRSTSRSVSRSPSRSPSQTPSGTSSRSLSRSETPSESDRSSTSSRASSRKDRHASKASSNKASSSRNQTMSPSGSESESHSDSESESDHRRSHSSSPHRPSPPPPPPPPPPPRSPPTRVPRGSAGAPNDRSDSRYRKDRYEVEHKYRQTNIVGWDRRNRDSWQDPYGRGAGGDRGYQRRDRDRRRRSRTPPARRDADQRRPMEEASTQSHSVDNTSSSRPVSSRDHYRRGAHSDSRTSSDGSSGNAQAKSSSRSSNLPSNESWSAERRKQSQSVWMGSGSVRYTGHKDIKLTLNMSAGKAPSSTQSPSSRQPQHSPPRQAEASSSSSTSKDPEKRRWPREPESSQRHSSPRDDVTSSQVASKPIKRAADSVLTPRHVETHSNKRNIEESTSKRAADDKRPLKRSADSAAANTKRTLPETLPIKQSRESRESLDTSDSKSSHASNTARREELLRELKAVEDAIARKRARIE